MLLQKSSEKINWRVAIGKSGEALIKSLLKREKKVVESTHWFDPEKDGIVDEKTFEVKTLMENYAYNGFILGSSQWKKCEQVDRLFFLRIPEPNAPIRVYECPKNYRNPPRIFMNGDNCRVFKLTSLELYDTVHDESLGAYWRSLTKTKYMRSK